MKNNSITIQERTKDFAIRVIVAYTEINKRNHFNDASVVLSKQFLRSGTSVGVNVSKAVYAQSNADFVSKYSIALKEASECKYWCEVMIKANVVPDKKFKLLINELEQIIKILTTIITKLKSKTK